MRQENAGALPLQIISDQATTALVFKQVSFEHRQRKLARIGKINGAISRKVQIVRTVQRYSTCFRHQTVDRSVQTNRKKPFFSISNDQVAVRIKNETEGPAVSVGYNFRLSSIREQTDNASILDSGEDFAAGINCHAFRTEAGTQ